MYLNSASQSLKTHYGMHSIPVDNENGRPQTLLVKHWKSTVLPSFFHFEVRSLWNVPFNKDWLFTITVTLPIFVFSSLFPILMFDCCNDPPCLLAKDIIRPVTFFKLHFTISMHAFKQNCKSQSSHQCVLDSTVVICNIGLQPRLICVAQLLGLWQLLCDDQYLDHLWPVSWHLWRG